jgi:hypothetical protein
VEPSGAEIARLGHQLNNMLTVVSGHTQLLASAEDVSPRVRRRLHELNDHTWRAIQVARELTVLATPHATRR